jgi:prophage DNA circulation protein
MSLLNTTPFAASLQPASFRGIPFQAVGATIRSGQRAAVHEYPYRDTPLTEPLGKSARQYVVEGFLVGDDVAAQYQNLLTALEADGPGALVHPVFGQLQVVALPISETEQNLAGRYVSFRLIFVEAGSVLYPTTGQDSQADTINAAAMAQNNGSFSSDVSGGSLPAASQMSPPAANTNTPSQTYNDLGDDAVTTSTTGFSEAAA